MISGNFIFSIHAIVFGLLAYFLWMYYRGFGRQYVKLWTVACLFISIHYVAKALYSPDVNTLTAPENQLPLVLLQQISHYWFVLFLTLGVFSAAEKYYFERQQIINYSALSALIAITASLSYGFDQEAVFNQFYLRISLPSFIFGIVFLSMAMFLFSREKQHFSSIILEITTFIIGIRYLLFSFASIIATKEDWLQNLHSVLPFFDTGAYVVIGFNVLMWIYGAERHAASNAINKARYLGEHDPLTGLLNREQVLEKLDSEMAKASANDTQLVIFLIDIKRFKFINDTYGLKTGDYILGEIAHRLSESILMPRVIGRLSGDSFLFVLEYDNQGQIAHAAQHLHDLLNRSYLHQEQEVSIRCSIGYCLYPEHGNIAEDLLQKANLALFHAENQQKETLPFADEMQDHGRHLMQIEKQLHQALTNQEFILYFQPQLNLLTNRLEGVEALIRWQHPEKGLVSPGEFLPHVDALGLNSKLDNYVLEKSCETIARWHENFNRRVTIAINITAVEFQDKKLISTIQNLLFKYNIPPKCLDLEITENMVMTDIDAAMSTIITLQNMGIKVSIDDFGTGYSSLAYLRSLPIDKIKIDRSFISEVAKNDSDLTIVKSMIELSHGLGKRVLAEGVESAEQLNMLRSIGCDAVQGYFISRPIPEQALAKYLKRK